MTEMNRREFAESVVVAALVPMLGTVTLGAPAGWWTTPAIRDALSPGGDLDAVADALAAVVRSQYGERLGAEDLTAVTRQIRAALGRAEQMRAVELANGDEPDLVFSAPSPSAP
jgi:hypothetical protein